LIVILLTVLWAYIRLVAFRETALPLTYVMPLLVCVWTRHTWHLWAMAGAFIVMAIGKTFWLIPEGSLEEGGRQIFFWVTIINIVAGATLVRLIMAVRENLDKRNALVAAQNRELEAQSEELAQQNEEIKVQSEELAQQNEEIEAQSEELAEQNEDLQTINNRLSVREEILQILLEATRSPESSIAALGEICRRSLHAIGKPADCVAVLRRDPDMLRVKVQSGTDECGVPAEWPMEDSIAQIVLKQDKTAYISDLQKETDFAAPFGSDHRIRSVLATPLRVAGKPYGLVVACSSNPGHWTQEQFHLIEWLAAQCGLVTESIRWQRAMAERTREMEAANQAKDQFLAMLSHELRTPLTPVLAAVGELENDERIPSDARADLRMMRRNVAIQSRLVDDLLDLTRLGRGKLDLNPQNLDFGLLLQETAAIVAPDVDAKDQSVDLRLGDTDGCQIFGDGPRLQQVFWNLLKNAIKFSPARANIRLTTRLVNGGEPRVCVEVSDDGLGIDPQHIDRIFQPFEQVVATGRRRGSEAGLGLGLAIAKAIVELHRGTISVRSDGLGRGATFAVELPVVENGSISSGSGSASGLQSQASKAGNGDVRILLVEDHADTGRVLARLLRNAGYAVEHAESAGAALQSFEPSKFDLVISDLGLPDESGLELMKKLRAMQPELPGICLSGYGMEDDLAACRAAGFAEHLTKPVDMQRLRAAILRVAHKSE
jgi:signal transduction histidine kinase/CheY-like chemotaxis protein